MAAPIDAFVAGQYYTFYGQRDLDILNFPRYVSSLGGGLALDSGNGTVPAWVGVTRTGFTLSTVSTAELVEGDVLGGSVMDLVYRGGNVFLSWEAISFRPGAIVPSWPWGMLGNIGTVGRLGSAVGGTLFMAAAPMTPAVGNPLVGQVIINALTARNAILAENLRADWLFDTRLRRIPIQMRLLPFLTSTYTLNSTGTLSNSTIFSVNSPIAASNVVGGTDIVNGGGVSGTGITSRPGISGLANSGFGSGSSPLVSDGTVGTSNLGTTKWSNSVGNWGDTSDTTVGPITRGITKYSAFPFFSWYVLI